MYDGKRSIDLCEILSFVKERWNHIPFVFKSNMTAHRDSSKFIWMAGIL